MILKGGKMESVNANRKHKRLSVAELRKCNGFENISDPEAEKTIIDLEKLSILFYELYMKQKRIMQKLTIIKGGDFDGEQRIAA
jgi:hypothetical protein